MIDDGCDAKYNLVFEGMGSDLDADRKAFGRVADRHDGCRSPEDVEPLCETDGIEIVHGAAFDGPGAFAMTPGRDAGYGTEEDRIVVQFLESFGAEQVELGPCV